jgi:hypothetical protein
MIDAGYTIISNDSEHVTTIGVNPSISPLIRVIAVNDN